MAPTYAHGAGVELPSADVRSLAARYTDPGKRRGLDPPSAPLPEAELHPATAALLREYRQGLPQA